MALADQVSFGTFFMDNMVEFTYKLVVYKGSTKRRYNSITCYSSLHQAPPTGCSQDAETDPCAIDITTNSLGTTTHYDKYNSWREGDTRLDWMGAQVSQGTYGGQAASGTPLAWTSSTPSNPGYQQLNTLVTQMIHFNQLSCALNDEFCFGFDSRAG